MGPYGTIGMSSPSGGTGWWLASDGRWYPPQARPGPAPGGQGPPSVVLPSEVPSRQVLRFEVMAVLAVGILPATAVAVMEMVKSILTHTPNQLHTIQIPGHPGADIALGILVLAAETSAVLLVAYVLARSGESLRSIGFNLRRLGGSIGIAALLVVDLFLTSVAGSYVSHLLHFQGLTQQVGPAMTARYIPEFVVASARTGLLEEIVVCGYLLHRLRQLGWSDGKSLAASTLLRASYHIYGGVPLLLLVIPMGIVFGRIYQRSQRLLSLVLAHGGYDALAYSLYLARR